MPVVERRAVARRSLASLACLIALFTALLPGTAAAAGPQASPGAESRVACGGLQCIAFYSGTNYTGTKDTWYELSTGCISQAYIGQPVRSYDNRGSRLEGYFYSGQNCTGTLIYTVFYNSRSANIGGTAYSFRADCVSCRSEG